MSFILRGNLAGELCADCKEPLTGSIVRFYRVENLQIAVTNVAADVKQTLAVLDEKTVAAKAKYLIAEAEIDENGNYEAVLDDDDQYFETPLMIDVLTKSVPNQKSEDKKPVQFTITTVQPQWRQFENDFVFTWRYCLPARFWCMIRSLFDAWVICGKIVSCEDQETPVIGVKVTAFDADWITDDELGSGVTDGSGHFRIDYTSKDFKQTFLSPLINIETPFPPFNSGPDVYFKVETGGGSVIYEETRSDGKKRERCNIGHCFCIELCVDFEPPVSASAWTGIGKTFTIPIGTNLNDFDAAGYAGTAKYAITGHPNMTGQVALRSDNDLYPVEYRFRISDSITGVNGAAPLPEANFTKIVGAGPDKNLFVPTEVGEMFYNGFPNDYRKIKAELDDFDDDGWLDVNKSILRTFTNDPILDPSDLSDPNWVFLDTDTLMTINTVNLTDNTMPTVATPGDPVPSGDIKSIQKVAMRFEAREVVNKATDSFNYLPASGQTLNAMVVNNDKALMSFDVVKLLDKPCDPISGDIDVAYTAYHPHLQSVNINIRSNSGAINKNLDGEMMSPQTTLPLSGNTNDTSLNLLYDDSLSVTGAPNNLSLITCTYIATFSVKRRLHDGDDGSSARHIIKAFYYDKNLTP